MKIRNRATEVENTGLQMTPMVDIVFQLLVFFMMSFKIVTLEGDFNIKMPLSNVNQGPVDDTILRLDVRLTAYETGELSGVYFNDQKLGGDDPFDELHAEVLRLAGSQGAQNSAEDMEAKFTCDFDLHYRHVIQAITAVTGRISEDGNIVKLIEKISFARPDQQTDSG